MAKGAYIGVNNVARKIKKMYIGVNGVARKIKKAYIGVNGVARLFFTTNLYEKLEDLPLTTYHNSSEQWWIADSNSSLAVFNDQYIGSSYYHMINASGVVSTVTQSTYAFFGMSAAGFSNYVTFMGGQNSGATRQKGGVTVNVSGSRSVTSFGSGVARQWTHSLGNGCNSGNLGDTFVLYAGGKDNNVEMTRYLDYMNNSRTWNYTTLSYYTYDCAIANNGTYAYIAGGAYNNSSQYAQSTVNTLNTSGTRGTATSLSVAMWEGSGARAGNLAIITGGYNTSNTPIANAYSYNTSNTKTVLAGMRGTRHTHSGIQVGDYAFFMGNYYNDGINIETYYADVYDNKGTKIDIGRAGIRCQLTCALGTINDRIYCADEKTLPITAFKVALVNQ